MKTIIIYTDGGSRGNPGPSAMGVVICEGDGHVVKEYSEYLSDKATNNEAEYHAAIFALTKLRALYGKKSAESTIVELRSDSELMVKQLDGKYKIIEPRIAELFLKIWNLKIDFSKVTFKLIPREDNKNADRLVNEALDHKGRERRLL
ncbi:MAG: ribonuclease HI family protein [bacterium]